MSKHSDIVIHYRQRVKRALVLAFGEKCCCCGLVDCDEVYDFHHINPENKKFSISSNRTNYSKKEVAEEAKKCCMVCALCHRKLTSGRFKIENFQTIAFDENIYFDFFEQYLKSKKHPKQPRQPRPPSKKISREMLKEYIRKYSFLECGRICGVSDNAIRKWCKTYNLPSHKPAIDKMTDEDWEEI